MDKILSAWIVTNPESPWLPLSVTMTGRDDSMANENGYAGQQNYIVLTCDQRII